MNTLEDIKTCIIDGIDVQNLIRITISEKKNSGVEYKKIRMHPAIIKKMMHLSFVYNYPTKDVTKNYVLDEAFEMIAALMESDFKTIQVFRTDGDFKWTLKDKSVFKFQKLPPSLKQKKSGYKHDHEKSLLQEKKPYLKSLGIINSNGKVVKSQGDKLKQIRSYINILDNTLKSNGFYENNGNLKIADMGSGKAYLSFALADHLQTQKMDHIHIEGVELRPNLVEDSNIRAQKLGYQNINFVESAIQHYQPEKLDALIALHACDTATDDAIFCGIQSKAKVIIVAPCCHKQLRRDLDTTNFKNSIYKYGIVIERQMEIITDTIRALILQAYNYKTRIIEFVGLEHSSKNLMIIAEKMNRKVDSQIYLNELQKIKHDFGIQKVFLEELLMK